MIVVGSANSSNSVRLVEVALEYGAKAAYRVDFANEVEPSGSRASRPSGVTSGASVPEILVRDVLGRLAEPASATSRTWTPWRRHRVRAPAGAPPRPEDGRQAVGVARAGFGRALSGP